MKKIILFMTLLLLPIQTLQAANDYTRPVITRIENHINYQKVENGKYRVLMGEYSTPLEMVLDFCNISDNQTPYENLTLEVSGHASYSLDNFNLKDKISIITLRVTDEALNFTTMQFNVTYKEFDKYAPYIESKTGSNEFVVLRNQYANIKAFVLDNYIIIDDQTPLEQIQITTTNGANFNTVDEYTFSVQIGDKDNNKLIVNMKLTFVDFIVVTEPSASFYTKSDYFIDLETATNMTLSEIVNYLQQTGQAD